MIKYLHKFKIVCIALLMLVFQFNTAKAQCCNYILSMHDSYGDGWNGGYLQVFVNNALIGDYSALTSATTETFQVCNGDSLKLVYTAGIYENENSYQLYDASYNLVFADGPTPAIGVVVATTGNCNAITLPGSNPCTAVAIDTGMCILADNTGLQGSGLNAGCASMQGADYWFTMLVPPSGNLSFATDSGSVTDTGLAVWADSSCSNISVLGCDDDSGPGYYSMLSLYNLTPGERVFIQVWKYGGGVGTFRLCVHDLGTVTVDSTNLPLILINTLGQTIIENTKITALMDMKYNGPTQMTHINDPANVYHGYIGIDIRGATSASYPQHPYSIETRDSTGANNNVSLLGMPAENDWTTVSNYNDRSLIRNTLALRLFGQMGNYSPRTSLCEVLVDSVYQGIYVFCEKIKRDANRVNISKLNPQDTVGDQLTGGYMLQQNYWDASNSFQSNFSPIDHPGFDVHFVYEYPSYDVIDAPQKTYIAGYIDSLETALYGANFADPSIGYRKYLDENSFIDYFLVNELSRNNDGFKKSVYFNKNKQSHGGKLKAGPAWDFDWAWKNLYGCSIFQSTDGSGWAHLINDCPTDNYSCGYYVRMLQDSTFANDLKCRYLDFRQTVLDTTRIFAYIDSMRNLVQVAQTRHFKKWPILGISGPAPEVGPIATTYNGEIDTLKQWIRVRLQWLDANMPGNCTQVVTSINKNNSASDINYFPNPSTGSIHFEGTLGGTPPYQMKINSMDGKEVEHLVLQNSKVQFDYHLNEKGVYYFTITNDKGVIKYGKLVVL